MNYIVYATNSRGSSVYHVTTKDLRVVSLEILLKQGRLVGTTLGAFHQKAVLPASVLK